MSEAAWGRQAAPEDQSCDSSSSSSRSPAGRAPERRGPDVAVRAEWSPGPRTPAWDDRWRLILGEIDLDEEDGAIAASRDVDAQIVDADSPGECGRSA